MVTKRVTTGEWSFGELRDLLRSGRLSSIVAEYQQAHGLAPHPFVLIENYIDSLESDLLPTPRSKKRGVSSTAPTREQLTKKSKNKSPMARSN